MVLTQEERALAAELLDLAADEFGNHGCNDFRVDDTSALRRIVAAAHDIAEREVRVGRSARTSRTWLWATDTGLMRHLAACCRGTAALTREELTLAAELLELADDTFANHGCNDFRVDDTPALRRIVAAARDIDEDEVGVGRNERTGRSWLWTTDTALMTYLAGRCRAAAGAQIEAVGAARPAPPAARSGPPPTETGGPVAPARRAVPPPTDPGSPTRTAVRPAPPLSAAPQDSLPSPLPSAEAAVLELACALLEEEAQRLRRTEPIVFPRTAAGEAARLGYAASPYAAEGPTAAGFRRYCAEVLREMRGRTP